MIVIPMAGQSSRFKAAGYREHKYMLEARGRSLFEHSVLSFKRYFNSDQFLFITLIEHCSEAFIAEKCQTLGIDNFRIITLESNTLGQAHTVYLGLKKAAVQEDEPVLIFNIDTFRTDYEYPEFIDNSSVDGYLETFIGSGKNWSNVLPKSTAEKTVARTAEKQEISEFCCTGLYYFRSAAIFCETVDMSMNAKIQDKQINELYIAPLYNQLIKDDKDIRYTVIPTDAVIFCGIPEEYIEFLAG